MFNMAKFSDRLGDIMFDKYTSTAAFSKAVGVSKSTIYRYLKGQRVPETEILIRIADYFHCTIDFLLGLEENDYAEPPRACPPFSERFVFLLKKFHYTKYRLSVKAKIPESVLYTWQKGECSPELESLLKLARLFDCSVDYVLGRGDY